MSSSAGRAFPGAGSTVYVAGKATLVAGRDAYVAVRSVPVAHNTFYVTGKAVATYFKLSGQHELFLNFLQFHKKAFS
jgi:hypothetical protein